MCRLVRLCSTVLPLLMVAAACFADDGSSRIGPLRVHPDNPRWFVTPNGRAVWLTGSHTWANRQERGVEGVTPDFDYDGYLDFLQRHGHNFIRLWAWEHAQWMQFVEKEVPVRYKPNPYRRSGPGKALDGGLKFDVTQFNDEYFRRLRRRVEEAERRGIYVGVMFFQGFSLDKRYQMRGRSEAVGNAWRGHPFNAANNINSINGNPSGDDTGNEVHTLEVPEVTRLQEAYVRKVIDTVGDLDNVLWEISNESHGNSIEWQYHMIRLVHEYEATRPKQHAVGMTGEGKNVTTEALMASPAEWISPPGKRWGTDPPGNDGKKIIIVDSDHCDWTRHEPSWAWKSLFRGNHFILMDGYMDYRMGSPALPDPAWDATRQAMGRAREVAQRIDLAEMAPNGKIASTGYCLATPVRRGGDFQCAVYLPRGGEATVDLSAVRGPLAVEWIETKSGTAHPADSVKGGSRRRFVAPFGGAAVLLLTGRPAG